MFTINDLTLTSCETITAFDAATGAYKYTLDELQDVTLAQSQDTTDVTGKNGRKLNTLKRNKQITISGTNGLVSHGLMETQTGSTFTSTATRVLWTDYLTVHEHAAQTTYTAVGTVGAEIEALYRRNADGTLGSKLTQVGTASDPGEGEFSYQPVSKALLFNGTEFASDAEIVVFYKRNITANVLENVSDHYSGKDTLYIDYLAEDSCANVYRVQIYIPVADFSGDFSLQVGDNQTVHEFEASALAGNCGEAGLYYTYTVFGANTEDIPVSGS